MSNEKVVNTKEDIIQSITNVVAMIEAYNSLEDTNKNNKEEQAVKVKDNEWVVNMPVVYTAEDINYIIVGAFEGGINHWLLKVGDYKMNGEIGFTDKPKGEPVSEHISNLLIEGKNIYIVDDCNDVSTLTMAKLLKGIQLNHTNRPQSDKEQYDAIDYDCIIQYAIFGKLVYG